jgi:1,4-dihydroxy-2-naphthoyl-CoA hydrolase
LYEFISQAKVDLLTINRMQQDNMAGLLGIDITAAGANFLCGRMPVSKKTVQPFGLLHGGASIVLAETLGSIASFMLVSGSENSRVAGTEVSGSHVRPVTKGFANGVCRPLRIGRSMHFWQIDIRDDQQRLCCSSRLTVSVSSGRKPGS